MGSSSSKEVSVASSLDKNSKQFSSCRNIEKSLKSLNEIKIKHHISQLFDRELSATPRFNPAIARFMQGHIEQLKREHLLGTIGFLRRERELIDSLAEDRSERFLLELETQRISDVLFSEFEGNVFLELLSQFDRGVAVFYEAEVRQLLRATCSKFNCMSYKNIPLLKVLLFIKSLDPSDISPITDQTEKKRIRSLLFDLLATIKCIGTFFTKLLLFLYSGNPTGGYSVDYHTMSLIMNTMLLPGYIFERYAFLLSTLVLQEDLQKWFAHRSELLKRKAAFEDLMYLGKLIQSEEKISLIRKNTHSKVQKSSRHIEISRQELEQHVDDKRMSCEEFAAHLALQVHLDLDGVFTGDLRTALDYLRNVDKFISDTFPHSELEVKIDVMRVILRMTTAEKFVIRIFMLSNMQVEFLDECQIFALFCQVLLAEIQEPNMKPPQEKIEAKAAKIRRRPMSTNLRFEMKRTGSADDSTSNASEEFSPALGHGWKRTTVGSNTRSPDGKRLNLSTGYESSENASPARNCSPFLPQGALHPSRTKSKTEMNMPLETGAIGARGMKEFSSLLVQEVDHDDEADDEDEDQDLQKCSELDALMDEVEAPEARQSSESSAPVATPATALASS